MTWTNCNLFTHNQSRSYLNHLVHMPYMTSSMFLKQYIACIFIVQHREQSQDTLKYVSLTHANVKLNIVLFNVFFGLSTIQRVLLVFLLYNTKGSHKRH